MRMEDSIIRWKTNTNFLDHVRAFEEQLSYGICRGYILPLSIPRPRENILMILL